ncbi:hypothetical protein TIFTF001_009365 [Ficus carica]|uniref:Uncharacterized protein n=1 Tax=Ficus carica TaxID=3494 RepID=A0AA87ZTP5_FICCA|nr:hypothetical protein TIFTF001_009365 [Ficus carica]
MVDRGGEADEVIYLVDLEEERLNDAVVSSMADNANEPTVVTLLPRPLTTPLVTNTYS